MKEIIAVVPDVCYSQGKAFCNSLQIGFDKIPRCQQFGENCVETKDGIILRCKACEDNTVAKVCTCCHGLTRKENGKDICQMKDKECHVLYRKQKY